MLHDFLTLNRRDLIKRCREKGAGRFEPGQTPADADGGIPQFLLELIDTLQFEYAASIGDTAGPAVAGPIGGCAAAQHGAELLRLGFSVEEVVRRYGDVCQSITEMALKQKSQISTDEFRTLNRCLDDAIAEAVASYGRDRESLIGEHAVALQDRVRVFSEEHQRLVGIAIQSFAAIRTGNVGLNGATGALLTHTLGELRDLAEWAMPEMRPATRQR